MQKDSSQSVNAKQELKKNTNQEESILCPTCHGQNKKGDNFCGHCGASLKERRLNNEADAVVHTYDDAFYGQKVEEFLRNRSYEISEQNQKCAKKVLNIPDHEKVIYRDAAGGDGEFLECVLTATGLYLKSDMLESVCRLSWTEFVNIQWTDSVLDCSKPDTVTVNILSSGFSGKILEELHTYLRGLSGQTQKVHSLKEIDVPDPSTTPQNVQDFEQSYKLIDRSICPNCGTKLSIDAKKCPICGRKARKTPDVPFKLGFMSLLSGDVKIGVAKATGTLTIYDDRLEFKRRMGNAAAVLTPYTLAYSAVKANLQPKNVYWMRDISGVKMSKNVLGVPSIVITMRTGEVYTFWAGLNIQSTREAVEDAVELIIQRI